MKRTILLIVSFVLITATIIATQFEAHTSIIAGAGNGVDKKINNLDQLEEVFDYISSGNMDMAFSDDGDMGAMAAAKELVASKSGKYDSLTFFEETTGSSLSETSGVYTSTNKYNRRMTIYMTDDGMYYISQGMIKSSYVDKKEPSNSYEMNFIFDWELYFDLDHEDVYAKFNVFNITKDDDEMVDVSDILGEWVRFESSGSVSMLFSMVNEMNMDGFSYMSMLINGGKEEFKNNGDIYTIDMDLIPDSNSNNDTSFVVSLANPTSPTMSLKINENVHETQESYYEYYPTTYYIDYEIKLNDNVVISNINNTVIDVDLSDAERLSDEEFIDFFAEELQ